MTDWNLSDREIRVLDQLVALGSNDAMASALVVSVKTIEDHMSTIKKKLGADNRVMLALIWERNRANYRRVSDKREESLRSMIQRHLEEVGRATINQIHEQFPQVKRRTICKTLQELMQGELIHAAARTKRVPGLTHRRETIYACGSAPVVVKPIKVKPAPAVRPRMASSVWELGAMA